MRAACLALGVFLAAGAAQAQDSEARNSPQLKACKLENRVADSRIGLTLCVGKEADRLDALVVQTYQAALAGLKPEMRPELQRAQELWTAYRDADCKAVGKFLEPGDPHEAFLSRDDCRLTRAARRLSDLQRVKTLTERWR